jgi:hypothetical protein
LDYHPHVHVVMPAATIDVDKRRWRTKTSKNKKAYLFNHKALAKVFRARLILQHVLPKDFRRTRNFGFLHANSKRVLALLQELLRLNPIKVLVERALRPTLRWCYADCENADSRPVRIWAACANRLKE